MFEILYRGICYRFIVQYIHQCFCKLETWADNDGLRCLSPKVVSMYFCRLRPLHPHVTLTLSKYIIPVFTEFQFLGLPLDSTFSLFNSLILKLNRNMQNVSELLISFVSLLLSKKLWRRYFINGLPPTNSF